MENKNKYDSLGTYFHIDALFSYDTGVNFLPFKKEKVKIEIIDSFIEKSISLFLNSKINSWYYEVNDVVFVKNYYVKNGRLMFKDNKKKELLGTYYLNCKVDYHGSDKYHIEMSYIDLYSDGVCVATTPSLERGCTVNYYSKYIVCDLLNFSNQMKKYLKTIKLNPLTMELTSMEEDFYYKKIDTKNVVFQLFKYIYDKYNKYVIANCPYDFEIFPISEKEAYEKLVKGPCYPIHKYYTTDVLYDEEFSFKRKDEDGKDIIKYPYQLCEMLIKYLFARYYHPLFAEGKEDEIYLFLLDFVTRYLPEGSYKSAKESLEEIVSFKEKDYTELNIAICYEKDLGSSLHDQFLPIKVMQYHMHNIVLEMKKKYSDFKIREDSYELCDGAFKDAICICYEGFNKDAYPVLYNDYIKLFDISKKEETISFSLEKCYEENIKLFSNELDNKAPVFALSQCENVFFYVQKRGSGEYEMKQRNMIRNCVTDALHYYTLFKSVDDNYNTTFGSLSDITHCSNRIKNIHSGIEEVITKYELDTTISNLIFPYHLQVVSEKTINQLELKKELRVNEIRKTKEKQSLIFNILIGIFSAFGIASSIISLMNADTKGAIVSTISIIAYLLIVITSYVSNYNKSNKT